jgi:hypothetical protein
MLFDTIINFVLRFLILILFVAVYTYIIKLEDTGCACSEHESRTFLKNFSLFSFLYLIVTMFVSPQVLFRKAGSVGASLYVLLDLIYIVLSIVFFWQTIAYTRFLVNEKCKCSEDYRRELIMWGSFIEVILIVMLLLINLLLPVIGKCAISVFENVDTTKNSLRNAIKNPFSELKKSPSHVKDLLTKTKKTGKKVIDSVKKVVKK